VYALDWRGFGRSPRGGEHAFNARTLEETHSYFIDSLEKWRKAQGLERMALMGHSMGGYLVSHYALAYPERVSRLFLISPVGQDCGGDNTKGDRERRRGGRRGEENRTEGWPGGAGEKKKKKRLRPRRLVEAIVGGRNIVNLACGYMLVCACLRASYELDDPSCALSLPFLLKKCVVAMSCACCMWYFRRTPVDVGHPPAQGKWEDKEGPPLRY